MLRINNIRQNYKIISEVGHGAYGKVYKAQNLNNKKLVALKKLKTYKEYLNANN